MPKETVGVRLDPRKIHDLDEIAEKAGHTRSEEVEAAIERHLSESTALALPEAGLPVATGTGDPLLEAGDVARFLLGVADLETVREAPKEVIAALPLFLTAWEGARSSAPPNPPKQVSDGRHTFFYHPQDGWYRSWIEERIARLLTNKPPLSTARALMRSGLLPTSARHSERVGILVRLLSGDADRHRAATEWQARNVRSVLDGLTDRERTTAAEAVRLARLQEARADVVLDVQRRIEEDRAKHAVYLREKVNPKWHGLSPSDRNASLSRWANDHAVAMDPELRDFLLLSVPEFERTHRSTNVQYKLFLALKVILERIPGAEASVPLQEDPEYREWYRNAFGTNPPGPEAAAP